MKENISWKAFFEAWRHCFILILKVITTWRKDFHPKEALSLITLLDEARDEEGAWGGLGGALVRLAHGIVLTSAWRSDRCRPLPLPPQHGIEAVFLVQTLECKIFPFMQRPLGWKNLGVREAGRRERNAHWRLGVS